MHSLVKRRERKRKTEKDDNDCDDDGPPLMVSERKYRVLLVKDAMLLRAGAFVQFP
jgi:hypothetical protein